MKKLLKTFLLSLPVFMLWLCTSSSGFKEVSGVSENGTQSTTLSQPVVLELFTSQGCSSCPSADGLLEKYSRLDNVIALSFHVDYWDRLGWKDPYSSHEFTKRQYKYASLFNSSVFTPQLVINGENQKVGSDAAELEKTLKAIRPLENEPSVSIKKIAVENGKALVQYSLSGTCSGCVLNMAVVEKKTLTPVRAGENSGANLRGTNVVRNFKVLDKIGEGNHKTFADIPYEIKNSNMVVVLYLQQSGQQKILSGIMAEIK